MTRQELFEQILRKQSFLCVGLDPELPKLPPHLLQCENPVLEFCKGIIDATHHYCVAYKPNLAFFEALGPDGLHTLAQVMEYVPPDVFTIADAKRGDIGNTSRLYAQAYFERFGFDAITVAPYMGEDSVKPFLAFPSKWVVLLALTSNAGSRNFQFTPQEHGLLLYEKVIQQAQQWGGHADALMYVAGATHPEQFARIRELAPQHFLLVPGVGAQGGDLAAVCRYGMNAQCGLLVNASRAILYADSGAHFAQAAGEAAQRLQIQMKAILEERGLGRRI